MTSLDVLSLFDGIGCGRVAWERASLPLHTFFASEIDPDAIAVHRRNYPDTVHLGDVRDIDFRRFLGVEMLMGGSPCQDLSIAKPLGEGLRGESSRLFWYFVEAVRVVRPRWFLYENVVSMGLSNKNIISTALGVEPIEINSSLVSAQSRRRFYWTNIRGVIQPQDLNITLRDICDISNRTYRPVTLNDEQRQTLKRTRFGWKYDKSMKGYYSSQDRAYGLDGKMCTLMAARAVTKMNVIFDDGFIRALTSEEAEMCQTLPVGYTGGLGLSDNVRADLVGNGWTVDVVAHILKHIDL